MSLKHAILGFLSFQPMTGYDLKKVFDRSVRHFWPANQSQIYRTLADLKDEGLVSQETIEREDRLDMKVYDITADGRTELMRWLTTPLPHQDYREAFLIQIYFGGKLSNDEVISLLKHQIEDLEAGQAIYTALYQMYQAMMKDHPARRNLFFSTLSLEYGISSNKAAIHWLNSVVARLESEDYSLQELAN
ncbi:MAG: PadR family transcriptional regulator [Anaerolineaceae bacterium]|nr:PadR family transcriptional regulator [Anaerolineaceae bacterium]